MFSVNGEAEAISTPAGKVSSSSADLGRRRTRADGIRCCFVDSGVEAPEPAAPAAAAGARERSCIAFFIHRTFTNRLQCTVYYRYKYRGTNGFTI